MKTNTIVIALGLSLAAVLPASAQRASVTLPDYKFTVVKENPITSVKNQANSSTCWAFSTIGFVESEIIRINNIKDKNKYPDLSEFFVIAHSYSDRAEKYVRLDGKLNFSPGSEADDVLHVIRDYGMAPQAAMPGLNYGTELPAQNEVDAVLAAYVAAVAKAPNGTLTTAWKKGVDGILEAYHGPYPTTFTVDGKSYTPASYRDALKFNPDDYVTLSSFTHHPFYTKFALEVADNWRWDEVYNLPIDEFMQCVDNAIMNGYTLAWGADVSDPGFGRTGVAMFLDTKAMSAAPAVGSDQARWTGAGAAPAAQSAARVIEKKATQEQRQIDFDNKTLTDDHGMQIFGIAKNENGEKFYMVKNSWGVTGKYDGIFYVSEQFVKGESMDIMLHKNALPQDIRKKLGL